MSRQILVGADPEVFVKRGGMFQSAHGLIEGDKRNPKKVHRGAVQVDGMALEFNIDPAANETDFCINIQQVYQTLCQMVPEYEVHAVPVADFCPEYMKQQPPAALELGCDPDYNAWTSLANPRPNGERPFRTASGHVHVGWTKDENPEDYSHRGRCDSVVRELDFYLGLPSLFVDKDVRRRELYGKAGACRYKPYGVEYRTLSNFWLNSEELIKWVFRATQKGVQSVIDGHSLVNKYGDIQHIINTSDKKAAERIIVAENLEVCYG